jgi:hypothetical protein
MFHVHCKLPNASTEINGVSFVVMSPSLEPDGVVHVRTVDPVSGEVAAQFADISGYEIENLGSPAVPNRDAHRAPEFVPLAARAADTAVEAPRRRGRPSAADIAARAAASAPPAVTPEPAAPPPVADDEQAAPAPEPAIAAALAAAGSEEAPADPAEATAPPEPAAE